MLSDFGLTVLQCIVNTYLMLFCVNVMGINQLHFAAIIFICRALDALNDTLIGRTVDKHPGTRNGKMKPWIKWFAIPYAALTLVLFINVGSIPYTMKIIWVLFVYFVWGIVATFVAVPVGALINVMTSNENERTLLSSFRTIGSFAGNYGVPFIAPLIVFDENQNPIASRFLLLSVILGVVCVVSLWAAHALIRERVVFVKEESAEGQKKVNYLKIAKSFLHNRLMIGVVMGYVVAKIFTQTIPQLNQYVFMVYFQDTDMLSITSISLMIPTIVGAIVVPSLTKRFGKKNMITWPLLISALLHGILLTVPMSPVHWIIIQMLAQLFNAPAPVLIWSLIADASDYQAYLVGERNDGTTYATVTFLVFFAGSVSTSLIAIALEFCGYVPDLGSLGQMAGVADNIRMLGAGWPLFGSIATFLIYKFVYNISDEEMRKVRKALNITE